MKQIQSINEIPVETLIKVLREKLQDFLQQQKSNNPNDAWVMIGIHTGGLWVAERLHQSLAIQPPLGQLNISFYRDDFTRIGLHPQVKPSELPFDIEGKNIILVDDVLHTGRTIRAAMNEIFDYGRPNSLYLAVLMQRNGRELPIQADFFGAIFEPPAGQNIKLKGPDAMTSSPMAWVLQNSEKHTSTNPQSP